MDLRPLLPKITAPTLIIGGDEDMMTPWQQGGSGAGQNYLVEHIRGAKKHVIKGSSHSTLFDGTEENCRVVMAFLKGEFERIAGPPVKRSQSQARTPGVFFGSLAESDELT